MSKILMVVTAAISLTLKDGTEHPTGFWAEELAIAHRELIDATKLPRHFLGRSTRSRAPDLERATEIEW